MAGTVVVISILLEVDVTNLIAQGLKVYDQPLLKHALRLVSDEYPRKSELADCPSKCAPQARVMAKLMMRLESSSKDTAAPNVEAPSKVMDQVNAA